MRDLLYRTVALMAEIHDRIPTLNDRFPTILSDKQLHFLVIGLLGMLLFFIVHPIFQTLIRHGRGIVVSWFYVLTLILVITFGIEVGQQVTHTGRMEFADMVFGVLGFLALFAVFAVLRGLMLLLARSRRRR